MEIKTIHHTSSKGMIYLRPYISTVAKKTCPQTQLQSGLWPSWIYRKSTPYFTCRKFHSWWYVINWGKILYKITVIASLRNKYAWFTLKDCGGKPPKPTWVPLTLVLIHRRSRVVEFSNYPRDHFSYHKELVTDEPSSASSPSHCIEGYKNECQSPLGSGLRDLFLKGFQRRFSVLRVMEFLSVTLTYRCDMKEYIAMSKANHAVFHCRP